jgi:hypothetical protein
MEIFPPFILITGGVVGSGKTSLINSTFDYLHLNIGDGYVKILIDDLIEMSPIYKHKIDDILQSYGYNKTTILNKIKSFDRDIIEEFRKAYFNTRQKEKCLWWSNEKTCDDYLDDVLIDALNKRKNIVLETTGKSFPLWLMKILSLYPMYSIIFSFAILELNELVARNIKRTETSLSKYLSNPIDASTPRLPDITPENLRKSADQVEKNIKEIIRMCIEGDGDGDENRNQCEFKFRLLVFYTFERQHQLVYDNERKNSSIYLNEFFNFVKMKNYL